MEIGTTDTYAKGSVYPVEVGSGIYSSNKYNTKVGTWDVTPEELEELIEAAGYDTAGYHASIVKIAPEGDDKDYSSTHRTDNSSVTDDPAYQGESLDPSKVNAPYVFMERDWSRVNFVTNDNIDPTANPSLTGRKTSSKATIRTG